jgi:hypothetical protein
MRHKNAGAEKSHQYCCNLNHGTHPYAQPALTNTSGIGTGLFRDDFVAPSKWFRRLFLGVPQPFRRHKGHKFFIPASSPPGGANPTKSPDVSRRRRHGLTSVISSPPQGPMRNFGERTWVKSSNLYQRRSSSGDVSVEKAARETATFCRRSLPSANRGIRRASWRTAEPRPIGPPPVINTATGKTIVRLCCCTLHDPRRDLSAQPFQAVQRVGAGFRDLDALDGKVLAEELVMHRALVELLRRQHR